MFFGLGKNLQNKQKLYCCGEGFPRVYCKGEKLRKSGGKSKKASSLVLQLIA